ncbi:MAG: hypothetical protein Q9179_001158 [Wetmoreana sp. 5 TL-2023]
MLDTASGLASKFDAYKDALEEMMTRASWQYTKTGLEILEGGNQGEHAPRLIDVESAFMPGQRSQILETLGYDFNIRNWSQLAALMDNGAAYLRFYDERYKTLLSQSPNWKM